jgi:hypothetical protein
MTEQKAETIQKEEPKEEEKEELPASILPTGKTDSLALTEDEKNALSKLFLEGDTENFKDKMDRLAMLINAVQGNPTEPKDAISRLINVKQLIERTMLPNYPHVALQVYLRLIEKYAPEEAGACKQWADYLAEAFISYKGKNWEYYASMVRGSQGAQEQQFFNINPQNMTANAPVATPAKRYFWQRTPKEEKSEFVEQ